MNKGVMPAVQQRKVVAASIASLSYPTQTQRRGAAVGSFNNVSEMRYLCITSATCAGGLVCSVSVIVLRVAWG